MMSSCRLGMLYSPMMAPIIIAKRSLPDLQQMTTTEEGASGGSMMEWTTMTIMALTRLLPMLDIPRCPWHHHRIDNWKADRIQCCLHRQWWRILSMPFLRERLSCRITTMNTFLPKGAKVVITNGQEPHIGNETTAKKEMMSNPRPTEKRPKRNRVKVKRRKSKTKSWWFGICRRLQICLIYFVHRRNVEGTAHHHRHC